MTNSLCANCKWTLNADADNTGQDPNEIVNYTNEDDLDVAGVLHMNRTVAWRMLRIEDTIRFF